MKKIYISPLFTEPTGLEPSPNDHISYGNSENITDGKPGSDPLASPVLGADLSPDHRAVLEGMTAEQLWQLDGNADGSISEAEYLIAFPVSTPNSVDPE